MFQEGDIVEIPLSRNRTAIGWILHISQTFKGAVGFVVFGIKGHMRDDVIYEFGVGRPTSAKVLGPLYTHIDALKHYGWKTFAHQALSDSKRLLTKRTVGGGVYVGDEYIGSIEEVDGSDVKPMLAMGMPVVHEEIERAFGSDSGTDQ